MLRPPGYLVLLYFHYKLPQASKNIYFIEVCWCTMLCWFLVTLAALYLLMMPTFRCPMTTLRTTRFRHALAPDWPLSTNRSISLNDLSAQDHVNFGRSRASHQKYLLICSLLLHPLTSLFESLIILQTNPFNILLGSPWWLQLLTSQSPTNSIYLPK